MLRQILFVFILTQLISQMNCFHCETNDNYRVCTISGLNMTSPFQFKCDHQQCDDRYNIKFTDSTTTFFPSGIFSIFYQLQSIDISNCSIEQVPTGTFTNYNYQLKHVDLSKNKIKILDNYVLPSSLIQLNLCSNLINDLNFLQSMIHLTILDLSKNKVKILDNYVLPSSLIQLNLSSNLITDLNFLQSLIHLTVLDLSFNKIELNLDSFSLLEKLKILKLKSCGLVSLQFGTFSHQKQLEVLDISYNYLMKIDWHIFTANSMMNKIFIDGNNLTEFSTVTMISVFQHLQIIGLSDNNWNCTFLSALIRNLRYRRVTILQNIIRNESNIAGIFCSDKTTENVIALEDGKPRLNLNKIHHTEDTELKEAVLRLYEMEKQQDSHFDALYDNLKAMKIIVLLIFLTGLLFISFKLTIFYFYKRKTLIRKTTNSINILDDVL